MRFSFIALSQLVRRYRSVFLICGASLAAWSQSGILIGGDNDALSVKTQVWVDRILAQFGELSENDRAFVVAELAEVGQIHQAKALAREKLPESRRAGITVLIAAAQSYQDDVAGALQTLDGLPKASRMRDRGRSLIAIRQAQRGNVAAAQRLAAGIADQTFLDNAREAIVEAQMKAGDRKSAAATAKLIQDRGEQREAQQAIAAISRQDFLPEQIPSPFLRGQVAALSLFSKSSSWKSEALSTLAAAYQKDDKAIDANAASALEKLKALPKGLDRATGFAILAVAFSHAGKTAQAERAGNEAMKAMSGDPVGISSLYGKPIVIYAMIQLGHYEQIDKILEAAQRNHDSLQAIYAQCDIRAIGAALAAKREDQRLDEVWRRLRTPIERIYFASGVLCELSPRAGNKPK